MDLKISHKSKKCIGELKISGSKSETNRLLILKALFSDFDIKNISNSDDSKTLEKALKSKEKIIDIHHAGTAMRFLTAYFSQLEGRELILTGSKRMQERPIKILVDSLISLGADISYEKKIGYPPLRIKGKKIKGGSIKLPAGISSQYVSALLLIAPALENGIELSLLGKTTSLPYIEMTLFLLKNFGVKTYFDGKKIKIDPNIQFKIAKQTVESDWSSASYFYSIVALSKNAEITLSSYKSKSLQGDSILKNIYEKLGVKSIFKDNCLLLKKEQINFPISIDLNLSKTPDIAQTIAVTCYGLGIGCNLEGLHTLKIKETDRLIALERELKKLGANIKITESTLTLIPGNNFNQNCSISTYNDHRMAMSFAPLSLKTPLQIKDYKVVSKSYPNFWKDLVKLNFIIDKR